MANKPEQKHEYSQKQQAIILIEWADTVFHLLPEKRILRDIEILEQNKIRITVKVFIVFIISDLLNSDTKLLLHVVYCDLSN